MAVKVRYVTVDTPQGRMKLRCKRREDVVVECKVVLAAERPGQVLCETCGEMLRQ